MRVTLTGNLTPAKRALLELRLKKKATAMDAIPRRAKRETAPLSFAQELLWLQDQLLADKTAYNSSAVRRMNGPLNVPALRQALQTIVDRHDILRTTYAFRGEEPIQLIHPPATVDFPVIDLQHLPLETREAEGVRLLKNEISRPFDLSCDAMVRARLIRLAEQQHLFFLLFHHISIDGWSKGVLWRELATLYEAFYTGRPSPLPPLPIQYADFAAWQRRWFQGATLDNQLNYWKTHLAGASSVLELPADHPRPPMQSLRGSHLRRRLPKELLDRLRILSQREGVTMFMMLLAAFEVLLLRHTGQDDLVVGTPIAGRNRPEIERLIGYFTNTLALRTDLSGNPRFPALLQRVKKVALGALDHADLPFEKLVQELQPPRDLSRSPVFQVMFVYQDPAGADAPFPALTISQIKVERNSSKFDLGISMNETPEGLEESLEYSTDLFEEATMARFLDNFQTLLEGIVADPDRHLSALPVLPAQERHQVLVRWNATAADFPQDMCIHQLFEAQVERTPDALAVIWEETQLTYRELNVQANQLAHHLKGYGVGPDVRVGIAMESGLELAVGLLGILKAGGAYLPLDPAYPRERLGFMLADARIDVLVTQSRLLGSLPTDKAKVICLDQDYDAIRAESSANPSSAVKPDNLAYVIYTSGSTGQSKGVTITHRGLVNHNVAVAKQYGLRSDDRVLQFSSISFDIAVEELFPSWITGAAVVMRPRDLLVAGDQFLQWLEKEGITVLDLPTAYWHAWVHELSGSGKRLPGSLRLVIVGGEKVLAPVYRDWSKIAGKRVRWINTYGPTETTVVATVHEPETTRLPEQIEEIPIGRPIANIRAFILDARLEPVPVGLPGELVIGGIGLARGYLNRPEQTAEKFIPDPFSGVEGARLYKTGDLARFRPDGQIEFLGRTDHQVKIRGFRVELGEIENVLSKYPKVHDAVVIAREEQAGEKRLVAYVVPAGKSALELHELRKYLDEKLPGYLVPSAFVVLEQLPLTPNGKVDRLALPAPDQETCQNGGRILPRNGYELELAMIWEEVLGLKNVGVQDNFFELGGHSMSAVRMLTLIEKTFGQKLPLVTLFQAPTIERLVGLLNQESSGSSLPTLVPIKGGGSRPPLFGVAIPRANPLGYAFLARHLDTDQPLYILQSRVLLEEETEGYRADLKALAASYLREIRALQPEGPYHLIGQCQGAHIAFEMAVQLQQQDQRVAFLGILDTESIDTLSHLWYIKRLQSRSYYYWRRLAALLCAPIDEQRSFLSRKAKGFVSGFARMLSRNGHPENHVSIKPAKQSSSSSPPYRGRITLFRIRKQQYWRKRDLFKGWGRRTAGGVDVHFVPGDHLVMLREPHVQVLAEQLTACLASTDSELERIEIPDTEQVFENPSRISSDGKNPLEFDRGLPETVAAQSVK